MRKTLLVALLLLIAAPAFAQRDFSKVEIKVTQVAGTVYMLEGAGGNIGVSVGDDGVVLVDDQYAPLVPKITAALKTITDKPVKFVLNTHWHGDHTGGNEALGASAPIIAHTNVRKRLATGADLPGRKIEPAAKGALPVITFDDRLVVHLNGEDIRAIHFPQGHTDGDSVIYFTRSNVVHMGDDFFAGSFPFVDIDSGGSVRGLIANIEKIVNDLPADVKIIPGHGALSNVEGLNDSLKMLKGTLAAVEAGLKAGKSVDQLKQEKVLAPWEKFGGGFVNADRFIDTLNRELSAARTMDKKP